MREKQRCVSLECRTQDVAPAAGFVDECVDEIDKATILMDALRKLAVQFVQFKALLWLVMLDFGDPSSLHEKVGQARHLTDLFGSFM